MKEVAPEQFQLFLQVLIHLITMNCLFQSFGIDWITLLFNGICTKKQTSKSATHNILEQYMKELFSHFIFSTVSKNILYYPYVTQQKWIQIWKLQVSKFGHLETPRVTPSFAPSQEELFSTTSCFPGGGPFDWFQIECPKGDKIPQVVFIIISAISVDASISQGSNWADSH